MIKQTVVVVATSFLIVLWIYTGLNKLLDFAAFRSQLNQSPFIQPLAGVMMYVVPYAELSLAAMLVLKKTRSLALYLSYGLMLLFTGYVALMLNFAYDLPCSCGGIMVELSWKDHLWFNGAIVMLILTVILLEKNILFTHKRKEVYPKKNAKTNL